MLLLLGNSVALIRHFKLVAHTNGGAWAERCLSGEFAALTGSQQLRGAKAWVTECENVLRDRN